MNSIRNCVDGDLPLIKARRKVRSLRGRRRAATRIKRAATMTNIRIGSLTSRGRTAEAAVATGKARSINPRADNTTIMTTLEKVENGPRGIILCRMI